jgi:hypothetical protein
MRTLCFFKQEARKPRMQGRLTSWRETRSRARTAPGMSDDQIARRAKETIGRADADQAGARP